MGKQSNRGGVIATLTGLLLSGTAQAELSVGDHAPAFSLPGSDGSTHTLERYQGRSAVVLAWFPKAFTPG